MLVYRLYRSTQILLPLILQIPKFFSYLGIYERLHFNLNQNQNQNRSLKNKQKLLYFSIFYFKYIFQLMTMIIIYFSQSLFQFYWLFIILLFKWTLYLLLKKIWTFYWKVKIISIIIIALSSCIQSQSQNFPNKLHNFAEMKTTLNMDMYMCIYIHI